MQTNAPTRKPRNVTVDRLAHALVRLIVVSLASLPAGFGRSVGRFIGSMIWRIDKRHRKQVLLNMDIAFRKGKSQSEKDNLCKKYFEHVGLSLVEIAKMGHLTRETVTDLCDVSELKQFETVIAKGKGVLIVPAHHGNWELCGYAVSLMGFALKSVARPLDNPYLNEYLMEYRQRSGHVIIEKWKVLWKLKKMLDKGDVISMSVDQNGGIGGEFVPFFGSIASTVASPADLHVITKTPIIVATLNRKADGLHHVLRVWDVIEHEPYTDQKEASRKVLKRINAAVEKSIWEYPEQWLWIHRRWKTRPPGEVPAADGLPPLLYPSARQLGN